ncbi:hypothetical protein, partial [Pseudonocardia tropica]|uniref:hypothetical protein n=1 Tax=Pseudonocardia tropica TaxID=681289 RepID=UPI0031E548DE
ATRTALSLAAFAAGARAGALGRRAATPDGPADALRRRILVAEWAVPVATGAAVVAGALRRT